jgi:hypothetical protein
MKQMSMTEIILVIILQNGSPAVEVGEEIQQP